MRLIRGGRAAAEAVLREIDPAAYARSRNFLSGAVTRLSPYLRHGVLSLAEVRDHALSVVKRVEDAEKFISELGWRDYWQRVYALLGDGVWQDRETYKTGKRAEEYAPALPEEVRAATTGLACMDAFATELRETGYLHNHARMWVAAWAVHWLGVRWQAGARWFLEELLDADVASNNLSWQWVASTFAAKPYFFNRENLERYTEGKFCAGCARRETCPFDASYEELEARLFPQMGDAAQGGSLPWPRTNEGKPSGAGEGEPLVWVHHGALNPKNGVHALYGAARSCFVWDREWLERERPNANRVGFIEECLAEMPGVAVRRGSTAEEVVAAAREAGVTWITAMRTVEPHLLRAAEAMERVMPVVWVDEPAFVRAEGVDLKRFSRYWSRVKMQAMRART